jgi:leucyl/phenylalanyl-tRNA--protein transferase
VWCEPLAASPPDLAGGIYGVAIGGLFAGESMFHRVTDASKVALVALVERLRTRGYALFDVQMATDHTARMGAIEIPRREYLKRLREAVRMTGVTFA